MKLFSNGYMILACVIGISLQVLVTEIPYFVSLFGTTRLSLSEWGCLAALSAVPLVVHELLLLGGTAEQDSQAKENGRTKFSAEREVS